jgi:ABC-type bacteriocin/lantibiotic exporter with double-glycine peptidase domain
VAAAAAPPAGEAGWIWVRGLPEVRQGEDHDCGPAALSAVLGYWGVRASAPDIEAALHVPRGEGVSAGALKAYARARGFDAYVVHGALSDAVAELQQGRPVIVGMAKPYGAERLAHYEVVVGIDPSARRVLALDPAEGWRKDDLAGFLDEWEPTGRVLLVVLARTSPSPAPGARAAGTSAHR